MSSTSFYDQKPTDEDGSLLYFDGIQNLVVHNRVFESYCSRVDLGIVFEEDILMIPVSPAAAYARRTGSGIVSKNSG